MFRKIFDFNDLTLQKTGRGGYNIGVRDMSYFKTLSGHTETITYGEDSFAINPEISFAENLDSLFQDKGIGNIYKYSFALDIYRCFLKNTSDLNEIIEMITLLRKYTNKEDVTDKYLFIETGKKIITENLYQNQTEKKLYLALVNLMKDIFKNAEYPYDIIKKIGQGKGNGKDLVKKIISPTG